MWKPLLVYTFLACLFQGYLFLDRNEIIEEYQPILDEKTANFTDAYELSTTEYNLVIAQINNDSWTALVTTNTQIVSLKATITQAQNMSANNTDALNCLAIQQTAADKLTAVPMTCCSSSGLSYSDFVRARDDLGILAKVPNVTIPSCTTLNPLPNQDELFLQCIQDKILDLDKQFEEFQERFEEVRTESIDMNIGCLSHHSASISSSIIQINFQVTLCLSIN